LERKIGRPGDGGSDEVGADSAFPAFQIITAEEESYGKKAKISTT
jgi:hypothetical protein